MVWPFEKKKRVYLDSAAGLSPNPSSPHEEGRAARTILETARTKIARLTEVQADDILFTSGATEANALAILGTTRERLQTTNKPHILYLPSAHASIVENMKVAGEAGAKVEPLPVRGTRVDTDALKTMIRPKTTLVSMEAVCGETGVVWNTREVRTVLEAARSKGAPILLHVDASQAPLTEKITRAHFGADLLVFDASKISAVRGIGVLIAHRTIPLSPLYKGGGQERGLRPGTEAPELARKFAEALERVAGDRERFRSRSEAMRKSFVKQLLISIPHLHIHEGRNQAPHIVNVSVPGRDTDYIVALMDEAGFSISTRSACETDSQDGSRAVKVLTASEEEAAFTLRISWGRDTSHALLMRAAAALQEAVQFVDSHQLR